MYQIKWKIQSFSFKHLWFKIRLKLKLVSKEELEKLRLNFIKYQDEVLFRGGMGNTLPKVREMDQIDALTSGLYHGYGLAADIVEHNKNKEDLSAAGNIYESVKNIHNSLIRDPDNEILEGFDYNIHKQDLNKLIPEEIKKNKILIIGTRKDQENDLYSQLEKKGFFNKKDINKKNE